MTAAAAFRKSDVALVLSDLGSGGAQRVATTLARHWLVAGRKVTFVTLAGTQSDFISPPPGAHRIVAGGIGVSRGPLAGLQANLRRIVALRRALRATGAPVAVAFVAPLAVQCVLAATGTGIRIIAAERNDPARQSFGRIWNALRRIAYPRAALVTANTEAALTTMASFVPAQKLMLTPNPLPEAVAGTAATSDPRILLAVARLHRQKGLDVLLDAVAEAGAQLAGWRVVILGEGQERAALQGQAAALGLADRVVFAGAVPDPAPWFRAAAIFALPSRYEGMPNALLEAMAYGRPAVVTNASPGPLRWVEDDVTGLVVTAGDAHALATALIRLAGDNDLRRRLGDAAAARLAVARRSDDALARWAIALGWQEVATA